MAKTLLNRSGHVCNLCAIQDMTRAEVLRLLGEHSKIGGGRPDRSKFSDEMARLARRLVMYAADVAVLDSCGDTPSLGERLDGLSHLFYEHAAAANQTKEVREDFAHIKDVFSKQ